MTEATGNTGQPGWRLAVWGVGAMMLAGALVAKQFVGEPEWLSRLAQSGGLIVGIGVAVELSSRTTREAAYRTAAAVALGSALLLGWANAAVGIIGSENNVVNLVYGGVVLIGVIGAAIARLRPEGMARTLLAMAIAQASIGAIALVGRLGAPVTGPFEIVAIHAGFIALFVASAVLFRKAAGSRPDTEAA